VEDLIMLTVLRSPSRRLAAAGFAAVLALGAVAAAPHPAEARVFVGVGFGVPLYPPAYYPPPYYYYPPPVVYAPPPVVYAPPPAPAAAVAPPPAEPTTAVNPASAPYTAPNGQTCRQYQSTAVINGVQTPTQGTACLQPDGSWRIVN
jgi:hypothetical protein